MPLYRLICRRIAPAVLVAYLLASTAAGLFHRHEGACCDNASCATPLAAKPTPEHCHARCSHHSHKSQPQHHCANDSRCNNKSDKPANSRTPRSNDGCAVCQFLSEQSEAPALVTFEVWAPLIECSVTTAHVEVSPPVSAEHPARGPPQLG